MHRQMKQPYVTPSSETVELNLKSCILQTSKPDYIPELW